MERRLATILAADVVGYSRLMEADEEATLATLNAYRRFIDERIVDHRGRVFGGAGDSVIAEFASPVEAVRCGVKIQQELATRNAELPEDRRMQFRIGVNLGDVMAEGENLFGDGVNIAARLEQLADPGGIYVSDDIYRQVEGKVDVAFDDLGEQRVKNITKPLRVFRARLGEDMAAGALGSSEPLPLPDKPSIAVLPFTNISGDLEQEYFSDGITEDIITDLSKVSALFVIARNSVFTYKGRAVRVQEVSRDLGVRYVVEGSVRKSGNRVRITAQLIDGMSGGHMWAERYDRDLTDIFALQDEITEKIVAALQVKLTEGEQEQVARRYTENLVAYDYFLRGRADQARATKETNAQAREMFERAIELDPNFAGAYAVLSHTYSRDWSYQWSDDTQALERASEAAKMAVTLDDSLPLAHARLAWIYLWRRQHEQAIAEVKRAIFLDPNFAEGYARLGIILTYAGRPGEGIDLVKKAMRLDPYYPPLYLFYLGHAHYLVGQYEEAIAVLKRSFTRNPDQLPSHLDLAVIYCELGRKEEARAEVAEVLRISPRASLEGQRERMLFKDQAVLERYLENLRKAGLPE